MGGRAKRGSGTAARLGRLVTAACALATACGRSPPDEVQRPDGGDNAGGDDSHGGAGGGVPPAIDLTGFWVTTEWEDPVAAQLIQTGSRLTGVGGIPDMTAPPGLAWRSDFRGDLVGAVTGAEARFKFKISAFSTHYGTSVIADPSGRVMEGSIGPLGVADEPPGQFGSWVRWTRLDFDRVGAAPVVACGDRRTVAAVEDTLLRPACAANAACHRGAIYPPRLDQDDAWRSLYGVGTRINCASAFYIDDQNTTLSFLPIKVRDKPPLCPGTRQPGGEPHDRYAALTAAEIRCVEEYNRAVIAAALWLRRFGLIPR